MYWAKIYQMDTKLKNAPEPLKIVELIIRRQMRPFVDGI